MTTTREHITYRIASRRTDLPGQRWAFSTDARYRTADAARTVMLQNRLNTTGPWEYSLFEEHVTTVLERIPEETP